MILPVHASTPFIPADKGPSWDAVGGRLYFNGVCIKRCRRDARNQRIVLDTLQAEGWPESRADPLRLLLEQLPELPEGTPDPCTRLRETIAALNHGQRPWCLRFHTNGYGTGNVWVGVEPRRQSDA